MSVKCRDKIVNFIDYMKEGEIVKALDLCKSLGVRRATIASTLKHLETLGKVSVDSTKRCLGSLVSILGPADIKPLLWHRPKKDKVRCRCYTLAGPFLRKRTNHASVILPGFDFIEVPLIKKYDPQAQITGFENDFFLYELMKKRALELQVELFFNSDEDGLANLSSNCKFSFFFIDRMGHYRKGYKDLVDIIVKHLDSSGGIVFFTVQLARVPKDYYRSILNSISIDLGSDVRFPFSVDRCAVIADSAYRFCKGGFLPSLLIASYYCDQGKSPMFTWGFSLTPQRIHNPINTVIEQLECTGEMFYEATV